MTFHMLAAYSWTQFVMAAVMIGICLFLMLIILLQKGRGEGLAGAFGGGGGSSAFGAKTGDVFTWITVGLATVFIFLSAFANFVFDESAVAATTVSTVIADEVPTTTDEVPAAADVAPTETGDDASEPIPLPAQQPVIVPTTRVVIPSPDDEDAGANAPVEEAPAGDSPKVNDTIDEKESPRNP